MAAKYGSLEKLAVLAGIVIERKKLRTIFLKVRFDQDGIHYGGLFWRPTVLPWSELTICGVDHYSFNYQNTCMLYFWKKDEAIPREPMKKMKILARVDEAHFSAPYQEALWEDLKQYLPPRAAQSMEAAILNNSKSHIIVNMRTRAQK